MIPRILHRIWWGPPMPDEFRSYGEDWERLHPGWIINDWTDTAALPPLVNQRLMTEAPPRDRWRYRADVARLEILHRFGGVYVDADIAPLRPIDDLVDGVECALAHSANRGPDGQPVVSNAVIASQPGHPFIRHAITTLPASAKRYVGHPTARAVGPWHLQRCLDSGRFPEVTIWPAGMFYPQSNAARDRGEAPDLSEAYGWHRWATSRDRSRG